jgi:hypothetical protein
LALPKEPGFRSQSICAADEAASLGAGIAPFENQMLFKKWQNVVVDAAVLAPVWLSPRPVEFFRFVNNPIFIQFVRERVIGINMVLIRIAAGPVINRYSNSPSMIRITL